MGKVIGVWLVAVMMALCCELRPLHAQETNKPAAEDNKAKAERPEKPVHAYRVDFSVNELENGKKINTRHYSMNLNSGEWNQIKIGTRVPVPTSQTEALDVGTSINCRLNESGEDLALQVHSDFSNFSSPDEQHSTRPIIRQISISGSTVATSGKPVVIGAVDDPNSDRQFQLEATVTRLK